MDDFANLISNLRQANNKKQNMLNINGEKVEVKDDNLKDRTIELLYKADSALEVFLRILKIMQESESTSDIAVAVSKLKSVKNTGLDFDQIVSIMLKQK